MAAHHGCVALDCMLDGAGGFFAFLHQVALDESAEFDAAKAKRARNSTALNKMMTKASSAEPQSHRATYTKGHTCTCTCRIHIAGTASHDSVTSTVFNLGYGPELKLELEFSHSCKVCVF